MSFKKRLEYIILVGILVILGMFCMACISWAEGDTSRKTASDAAVGALLAQGRISVHILDKQGDVPVAARIHLKDENGNYYAPPGSILKYTKNGEGFFYADGFFEMDLTAGTYTIDVARGLEYKIAQKIVNVAIDDTTELTISIERWIDMSALGWYSGDGQINVNCDQSPTRHYLEAEDQLLMVKGEDLNLANLLAINPRNIDSEFFEGKQNEVSEENHVLYWNQEYRSFIYGHLTLFNLTEWIEPNVSGMGSNPWDYPPNSDICDMVHQQGGLVSYSHPVYASDPMYDVYDYPGGILFSATELPIDLALGKVDAINLISYVSTDSLTMKLWYKLLNCGFRLPALAGTDCYLNFIGPGWESGPPGGERAYVLINDNFTYDAWVDGLKAGRSFVTNGPMIFLSVDGKGLGEVIRTDAVDEYWINVEASVFSEYPLTSLEIVVNGEVVESIIPEGDGLEAAISTNIRLEKSSCIAVRCAGEENRFVYRSITEMDGSFFAHTSPIYCYFGDQPVYSAVDAQHFVDYIENFIAFIDDPELVVNDRNIADFENQEDKERLIGIFRQAQDVYREMASVTVQDEVEAGNTPVSFSLSQNFPNPFNPTTVISYQLPEPADVRLVIYDISGQRVKTLVAEAQQAGYYSVAWDSRDNRNLPVSAGIYIYKIQAGDFVSCNKMVVLK